MASALLYKDRKMQKRDFYFGYVVICAVGLLRM